MTRVDAIKLLSKLRELVEHQSTSTQEREAALIRIRQLRKRHKIGHFETEPIGSRGRPRKDPLQLRNKMIRFLVNKEEYLRITEKASRLKMSLSAYLRLSALTSTPEALGEDDY